jgi:MoaA/NifB/PqqE/SkfB family radical SAM enzyme
MFKKIFVEITNRCNLACDFCPASRRPKADMDPGAFALLLPQLAPYTNHLSLHVLGEPLLHPHFFKLLDLCHSQGLQVNLTTNGTLLPRHGAMLLGAMAPRQINISLHSVSGRKSGFDPAGYLEGVLAFSRLAADRGVIVSLRIWDLPPTPARDGGRWQEAVLSRLDAYFSLPHSLGDVVATGQGIRLAERIFLSQKELFDWPTLSAPDRGDRGTCRGLRDQVAILVDGTVVPCCLDAAGNIPLGNAFLQSFAEIIDGERAVTIARGFRERKVLAELCRRCSFRERF